MTSWLRLPVAFLALLAVPVVALAHEDTGIGIGKDGTLEGLPADYGPGKLTVSMESGYERQVISSITLELGDHRTVLPLCVTGLINTQTIAEVSASASWYHKETTLPYYLSIFFPEPGASQDMPPGFSLLFNLHTGKLIQMEATVTRERGVQLIPVDLHERCGRSGTDTSAFME